jgi:hypothetical protein
MARDRIIEAIKGATEVNLRYSAIALKLAKEYVKDLDGIVRNGAGATATDRSEEPPPAPPPAEQRPPILLVGEAGSEASGAFVLNNSAATELSVSLVLQGDLGPARAELVPSALTIAPGANAIVRIRVAITEAIELDRDYAGAVVAPGLSAQAIPFLIRRLPSEAPAKPSRKAKTTRRPSTG